MFAPKQPRSFPCQSKQGLSYDENRGSIKVGRIGDNTVSVVVLEASSTAQSEADRRRGLEETYLVPIKTTSVKALTQVTDYMSHFNKFAETYESTFQTHLHEYKILQKMYKQLVPHEVTHKEFVQRYFFRCSDLQRIQDELDALQLEYQISESATQKGQNTEQQNNENEAAVSWKGMLKDSATRRAAKEASEGARITLSANNPPTTVQPQVNAELGSDAVQAQIHHSQVVRYGTIHEGSHFDKNRSDAVTKDDRANQKEAQAIPSYHQTLYSRFRFPFRRNDLTDSKLELRFTNAKDSGGSKENLENKARECRSMSPTRRTQADSASKLNNYTKQLDKEENKSSMQTDEATIIVGECGNGVFASIRSKWEQEGNKKDSMRRPHRPAGKKSSVLEDSDFDIQHQMEMKSNELPASKRSLVGTEALFEPCSKLHPNTKSASVPKLAPPPRSNSTKELIKHMEAINLERRDRALGPPITTTSTGKIQRRMSESATAPGSDRRSMRNFRSSSFAYRNRGVSPARNGLHHSSDHSLPTEFHSTQEQATTSRGTKQTGNSKICVQSSEVRGSRNEGDCVSVSESSTFTGTGAITTRKVRSSGGDVYHETPNQSKQSAADSPIPSTLLVGHDDPLAIKSVVRADRRRNLPQTYTEPLESSIPEDPELEQFLKVFDLRVWRDEATLALARYQDTLQMHHGQLVRKGVVNERDFWCRYFYRCDEKRILKDMRQKQKLGILGQSSRNVFASPLDSSVDAQQGKTFARGPHFKCHNESSSIEPFSEVLKPVGSIMSNEWKDRSNSAGGLDDSSLKSKLKHWNNVTTPSSIQTDCKEVLRRHRSFTAEDRAKRYRNRANFFQSKMTTNLCD